MRSLRLIVVAGQRGAACRPPFDCLGVCVLPNSGRRMTRAAEWRNCCCIRAPAGRPGAQRVCAPAGPSAQARRAGARLGSAVRVRRRPSGGQVGRQWRPGRRPTIRRPTGAAQQDGRHWGAARPRSGAGPAQLAPGGPASSSLGRRQLSPGRSRPRESHFHIVFAKSPIGARRKVARDSS